MIEINHLSNWYPDFVSDDILDIDLKVLQHAGITHVVFDLDRTLVNHGSNVVSQEYLRYLEMIRVAGFTTIIGSNTRRDISSLSTALSAMAIVPAGISYKPLPSFYRRIIKVAGTNPKHIAMVGDNILNDVIGANHAGFTTVLVEGLRGKFSPVYHAYRKHVLKRANHSAG